MKLFMGKSTPKCRKDCDVFEDWKKLEDGNCTLVLDNEKLQERIKKLEDGLNEILLTQPIICDGNHQGDYACDLHKEIAEKALKKGGE